MNKIIQCILITAMLAPTSGALNAQFLSIPVDLTYLAQRADVIVQGKIVSVRLENLPGHKNFPTVSVTLEVEDMLRGPSAKTYVFRETNFGLKPQMGKRVYQVGQRLLLFLPAPSSLGLSSPIGFDQGRFHIAKNLAGAETITNEVDNAGLFKNVRQTFSKEKKSLTADQLRTVSIKRGPVKLDEFLSLTRSLITLPRIR
jgi:hypothetical protein